MPLFLALLLTPINDVTTTLASPPQYIEIAKLEANKGRDLSYPPEFKERQTKFYPDLAPLSSAQDARLLFAQVETIARSQKNWEIIVADPKTLRIEAVATTPMLRFHDDIVIEIHSEASGSSVHMRSKSRLGKSDLGANATRIRQFLAQIRS